MSRQKGGGVVGVWVDGGVGRQRRARVRVRMRKENRTEFRENQRSGL